MIRVKKGSEMTPRLLADVIGKHKREVNIRLKKLQDAYENRYDIYSRKKKPYNKPDNRISVNFAKYIQDTMNGFFCGIPIRISSDDETVAEYLKFLNDYNNMDDNNSELSKGSGICGRSYEMYYVDEESNIGITHLSAMESFMVYDDSVLNRPMFFVRYYRDADNVERGSYSDDTIVRHFHLGAGYVWDDEAYEHGFDGVPAAEFKENDEGIGIFEAALPAINAYNKALSEKANDVDYFADAYLKVLGARVNNADMADMRSNRVVNFEGDGETLPEVEFLAKPDADGSQEHLLDRLERLIFATSMVANVNDESFGNASGIAIRYHMASMSNLAKTKERKFVSAMNRRYRLIFSNPIAQLEGVKEDDWQKVSYQFTQNYPANLKEEAEIAKTLEGVTSKNTQLRVLSLVDDPDTELEAIREEEQAAAGSAMQALETTYRQEGGN